MKQILDIYIRARYPLLWVVTPEEERALKVLQELAEADQQRKRLWLWSATTGLINPALTKSAPDTSKRDPLALHGVETRDIGGERGLAAAALGREHRDDASPRRRRDGPFGAGDLFAQRLGQGP